MSAPPTVNAGPRSSRRGLLLRRTLRNGRFSRSQAVGHAVASWDAGWEVETCSNPLRSWSSASVAAAAAGCHDRNSGTVPPQYLAVAQRSQNSQFVHAAALASV